MNDEVWYGIVAYISDLFNQEASISQLSKELYWYLDMCMRNNIFSPIIP